MRGWRFKYHRKIAWKLDSPVGTALTEEIFDLEPDPEEVHNLAGDRAYKSVLEVMGRKAEEWEYNADDIWLFRDGVSAITSKKHQSSGLKLPDRYCLICAAPGLSVDHIGRLRIAKMRQKLASQQG